MSQARARKGRACWPESGPGATHSAAVGRGLARRALVYCSFVVGVHWCFPLVYSLSPSLQKRGRLGTSLALYPLLHRPHRGTCPAGRQTGLRPRLAHGSGLRSHLNEPVYPGRDQRPGPCHLQLHGRWECHALPRSRRVQERSPAFGASHFIVITRRQHPCSLWM